MEVKIKIGDKVKVIKRDVVRYGEIGEIVGKEKTMLTVVTPSGYFWKVEFDGDETGLYQSFDLKVVED